MTTRSLALPLTTCLSLLALWPATAQISVQSSTGYNSFLAASSDPESGDMSNAGDLQLQNDLELGGQLYLDGEIFMERSSTPVDASQFIYFAHDGVRNAQSIFWNATQERFVISESLRLDRDVGPTAWAPLMSDASLQLHSDYVTMSFVVDSNEDDDASQLTHRFTWYNNRVSQDFRAMRLDSVTGDIGDLTIAGSLTQDGFDLAEMFLSAAPTRAGELVAVDDTRPDAVRPATAGDGGRLLGIVATDPGMVLGGGALSMGALRRQWGDELADEFERERPTLEAELYANNSALRDNAASLVSQGAFAQTLERRPLVEARPAEGDGPEENSPATLRPALEGDDLREEYKNSLTEHEMMVFDATLEMFYERRFARVALAGRVPVQVDASFGPIAIGDPLTASPVPGVAMRATAPGWIVGTALEAMPSGSGTVLAFVQRNWFGGETSGRLAQLASELEALQRAVQELRGEAPTLRASLANQRRAGSAE